MSSLIRPQLWATLPVAGSKVLATWPMNWLARVVCSGVPGGGVKSLRARFRNSALT
ncbi:hypothetical protein D3C78_1887710 [compost metagenome]